MCVCVLWRMDFARRRIAVVLNGEMRPLRRRSRSRNVVGRRRRRRMNVGCAVRLLGRPFDPDFRLVNCIGLYVRDVLWFTLTRCLFALGPRFSGSSVSPLALGLVSVSSPSLPPRIHAHVGLPLPIPPPLTPLWSNPPCPLPVPSPISPALSSGCLSWSLSLWSLGLLPLRLPPTNPTAP